jgi:UDP-glucose 4-epimerase
LLALVNSEISGPLVIGSGSSVSVMDVVQLVESALGSKLEVRRIPAKVGEMPAVIVDNSRARSVGWKPAISLEDGIAEVAKEWASAKQPGGKT